MKELIFGSRKIHAPVIPHSGIVYRVVPKRRYLEANPRSLLHVSSELNRCNEPGVKCLYAALEAKTSEAEYRFHMPGGEIHQFMAYARCRALLDLRDSTAWGAFGLDEKDFFQPFDRRYKRESLPLHGIGAAIAGGKLSVCDGPSPLTPVTGFLYPSNAMNHCGKKGTNVAFFKLAFRNPDCLEPMNQTTVFQPTIADRWP